MLSTLMRPQPETLFGMCSPVMSSSVDEIAIALRSAPLGTKALLGVATPVGYQPSVQYWRMCVMAPAPEGLGMLVPVRDLYPVVSAQFAVWVCWTGDMVVG